jgi:predicted ATPase
MTLSEFVLENGIETFYFDSEKMNPRIADIEASYSNPDGTSKGIGIGAAIKSRFMSHGEVLKEFTVNRISKAKNCILFLDEPESSLSLRNQYILVNEIRKAEDTVQFVIATHCLPLIAAFDEVYSLEHLKWMKSDEFIRLNM